ENAFRAIVDSMADGSTVCAAVRDSQGDVDIVAHKLGDGFVASWREVTTDHRGIDRSDSESSVASVLRDQLN
ncbi:MAG: hypothetical protein ACOC1F_06160, partial [Myxococcota bacterium]